MYVSHELWYLVAGDVLDDLLSTMQAVTDRHARRLLWSYQAFRGQVYRDAYQNLGYVPNPNAVEDLMRYIADGDYDPIISEEARRPSNADSDGTTLTCDAPPEGYTRYVFSFDGKRFEEVGPLDTNNQPGAGTYVIALVPDAVGPMQQVGLPSGFLTVT